MRLASIAVISITLGTGLPAFADDCADSIVALFQGGAMDPFARPSWHEVTTTQHPDGSITPVVEVWWQDPTRVISLSGGTYILSIDSNTWTGSSKDGPWVETASTMPEDIAEFHRKHAETMMRNATEFACPGNQIVDGQEVTSYVFHTKTDPNEYGSWFGGLYTIHVDPSTGLLQQLEIADGIASWAPEKSKDSTVTVLDYDPSIQIDPP